MKSPGSLAGAGGMAIPATLALLFFLYSAAAENSAGRMPRAVSSERGALEVSGAGFTVTRGGIAEIANLRVADMNHDGLDDLVTVGQFDKSVRVHYGYGDGTFAAPVNAGALADNFTIGYANADTLRDIIAIRDGLGEMWALLNDGVAFTPVVSSVGPMSAVSSLAAGHLDGDTKLDYVVTPGHVVFGDGAGGVRTVTALPVSFQSVDVADLNGDGHADLALTHLDTLSFLINDGFGSFSVFWQTTLASAGADTSGAITRNALSDFDRNGAIDMVAVQPYAPVAGYSRFSIAYGDGAGGIRSLDTFETSGTVHQVAVADADGDGVMDIIGFNPGISPELTVLRGDGAGGFTLAPATTVDEPQIFLALGRGDFNRDGNSDFISGCSGSPCSLIVALNNSPPLPIVDGSMTALALNDVSLSLIDPAGRMIDVKYTTVAAGRHERLDENQDGAIDDRLTNPNLMDGEYQLTFTARYPDKLGGVFSSVIRVPHHEYVFFRDYPLPPPGDSIVFHYVQEYVPRTLPRSGDMTADATPRILWWAVAADAGHSPPYHFQLDDDYDFSSPVVSDSALTGAVYEVISPLARGVFYYWRYRASIASGWTDYSHAFAFNVEPACCVNPGDASGDGSINIADITFLIARIFGGGPASPCRTQADANGDGGLNIADVTFLIARIFAEGPAPACS
ncbi:MAG: FG-GAP-like repeat-containing protein [Candidatus Zixiibacteriota bacterium]